MKIMKFLAAAACLTFLFTACKKKDKDGDNYKAAIIGKWTYTETFMIVGGQKVPGENYSHGEYMRFVSDTVYSGNNTTTVEDAYGFYKVDGSNLIMADNKALTQGIETYHIDALNSSELALSIEEEVTPGVKAKATIKLKK